MGVNIGGLNIRDIVFSVGDMCLDMFVCEMMN